MTPLETLKTSCGKAFRRVSALLVLLLPAPFCAASDAIRVISLAPSLTELVCALDACDWLVAVDLSSDWPPEIRGLPKLGELYRPDLERIVEFAPDLVLSTPFGNSAARMQALGIPVLVLETTHYENLYDSLTRIGQALGKPQQADSLAQTLRTAVAENRRDVEGLGRPSVYYEIDPTPYTAGGQSYVSTLITFAGGRNIAEQLTANYSRISPEYVLRADPEVIILADAPHGVDLQQLADRPGWRTLKAVQQGRVCELTQESIDMLHRPGPRLVQALAVLRRCLHPDAGAAG